MTSNQIAYHSLQETKRSNLANEAEKHRSNVANEVEKHRSNKVNEAETERSNKERESETKRSNMANEAIKSRDVQVKEKESLSKQASNWGSVFSNITKAFIPFI